MAGVLVIVSCLLAGCRGAAQTDIVQREMRRQEDEIYAMQDYLAQYQQTLCDARRENALLRRQLAEQQSVVRTAPTKEKKEGPPPWKPDRSEGPAIEAPTSPAPPEIEPAEPEVPPLDTTTEPPARATGLDDASPAVNSGPQFRAASAEGPALEFHSLSVSDPPQQVWLDGEVVPGDGQHGARLLVDVEPLAADGGPAALRGTLSLMVLDPQGEQGARSLARWDFTPDGLQQAAEQVADGRAMRFRLQLPTDVTLDRPAELWVRLVDDEGGKVLNHVDIDLAQRAHSSSVRQPPVDRQVAQAAGDRMAAELHALAQRPGWSQWNTARPGEAKLLAERIGRAEGHWQAAAEPPPAAALGLPVPPAGVIPAAAQSDAQSEPSDDRYAIPSEAVGTASRAVAAVATAPQWSPTR